MKSVGNLAKKPLVFILFLFLSAIAAQGATFTVTKTADTNDGACNADCSLREAVEAAINSPQSSDIIEFSALFDLPQTIVLSYQSFPGNYEPIGITENLEIRGKGSTKLSISGGGNSVLFRIYVPGGNPVPTVILRDLHLTNAKGAIDNQSGNLTIESCYVSGNTLTGSKFGGAGLHHHSGVLVINNSTFADNLIADSTSGGAISLYTGTATITNSTFTSNSAVGGSVFHSEFGTTNFVNSTISGNTARADSFDRSSVVDTALGTITMTNVTVTGNSIHGRGTTVGHEGLEVNRIRIKNTIIAGNVSLPLWSAAAEEIILGISSSNVIGVRSSGNNIVGFAFPNDGFPVGMPNANGDYVGTFNAPLNPLLEQLDDNGGATETHALLTGSLAIDHGTSAGAPSTDQRGVSRPQGAGVDIGSFEKVPSQNPPLRIATDSNLPSGVLNQVYSMQIVAADGTPPYAFSLTSGDLPEGITLSNDGLLSGTLMQFGQFSFTVTAIDSESETAQKTFQLTIQPPPLVILTSTLPYGNQNQPYSLQIMVDGDAPPYVFSQTGGTLPNGMSLSSSGLLAGTPTEFGAFDFEVTVTDFFDTTAQRSFFLSVLPELRIPTNPNLPTGITNQFYSRQIYADGGFAPYVFSLAGGALPNGFSLSSSGVVSGTASQPGAFSFVVQVADAQGIQVQKTFNLTISELYVVTTAADTNDGVCDAHCSLREAVAVGDSIPGSSNVIEFSAFFDNPTRLQLNSPIIINKTTEIRGKGRNKTLISSANPNVGPKFRILGTGDTVFRDLRMDEGNFFVFTRAIENQSSGRLTLANSIFQGSEVTNVDGGAILQTAGTLVADNSTFRDNFIASLNSDCAGRGAAIAILGGTAKITNSTFSLNSSPSGSVIYANGAITIENSTISYNYPSTAGCGLSSNATILNESGSMTITNSTVFQNFNNGVSGSALSGNIAIKNSIIARNLRYQGGSITSPNIGAGVVSLGYNLIEFAPALAAGLPNANNDYVGTAAVPLNPLLNALALNGGETETHMPQGASLSINNGASAGAPPTDQRGVARPQGAGIDIGAFETDVPVTSAESPAGADVNTALGTVSVTFSNVTDAGTTTQIPIYPAISGTLPGGFSFGAGYPAFQITTTANYSGAILVCIQIPNVSTDIFNNLRLFHNENGVLVDRTFSRNNVTRTICAQTTSLSPFVIAESLAPTAAGVSISGRILAEKGAVAHARVLLTEANGTVRTAVSNSFGYYRFDGIEAGQIVTLEVRSKLYQFEPRVVAASDNLSDVDFTASEITRFGKLPDD